MNKNLIIEEEKSSKLLDIITTVITYIIVGLCLVVSIFSLTSKATGGTPQIGDNVILNVQTNSMTGIIDVGDIIFVKTVEFDENMEPSIPFVVDETIVSFKCDVDGDGYLDVVTHLYKGRDANRFVFQGTYKENENDVLAYQYVAAQNIIGVYEGAKLPGVGHAINFLQSSVGFFVCFILPIFLFVCYQGYRLICTIMEVKRENAIEAGKLTDEEREREKERIRQEILKELEEKNNK